MAFGPGDVAANDWAVSLNGSYNSNFGTTVYASGGIGRVTDISCRWGVDSGTVTGHHDNWGAAGGLVVQCVDFSNSSTGTGVYATNNTASPNPTWIASQNYFGGFTRVLSQNSHTPFKDGVGGSYGGIINSESNISGYTANWAGVSNPGGVGWSTTFITTQIYVKRNGTWQQVPIYVQRSGSWSRVIVSVKRSGSWIAVNWFRWMTDTQQHIPEKGLEVDISIDNGIWEPGVIVEKAPGWFGPGDYFNPRYNSEEPEEVVAIRSDLYYEWDRALRWEDYQKANLISRVLWPIDVPGTPQAMRQEVFVGPVKSRELVLV